MQHWLTFVGSYGGLAAASWGSGELTAWLNRARASKVIDWSKVVSQVGGINGVNLLSLFKLIARVNGANSGALYVEETGNIMGYNKITKPEGHTWKSFCDLLLMSLPKPTREHYITRFRGWIKGWRGRGYDAIPDEAPKVLEDQHWAPSYRRLCKVLLRNDWWCKGLGLTQPKSDAYGRYLAMKKQKQLDA